MKRKQGVEMAKILIVEDEKSINDLILMNLSLVGHICYQAFDGVQAVSALNECNPDLVLLDVMIPYRDGFSLMQEKVFKEVPVIFLTAKDAVTGEYNGFTYMADENDVNTKIPLLNI